jgi:hypothetical protein
MAWIARTPILLHVHLRLGPGVRHPRHCHRAAPVQPALRPTSPTRLSVSPRAVSEAQFVYNDYRIGFDILQSMLECAVISDPSTTHKRTKNARR